MLNGCFIMTFGLIVFFAFEVAVRDFFVAKVAILGLMSTGARLRHDPVLLVRLWLGSTFPFRGHAWDADAPAQLGARYETWATTTAITHGAHLHKNHVS